ncbi:hypothetical protein OIU77_026280 [Salix suchowensis]|uniref:CP12 domain-containing protein n=1 Tax=Salix suchowensis TaxID=1278906 RepID=A0ABQ9BZ35_9ROSI|nr:hypothetical protein OIU77_026280 [Salix suchowensis]
MASLSLILSPSNFSSRSDVFGNKLFNGRSLAMKGTGREWYGSKRVVKEARVKANMGGGREGGGGVAKFKGTQMREKQLTEMIETKVVEAKEVCAGDETSDECKVAWDEVEEVSQAKADFRRRLEKQDPLEYYCQDNPEIDECRVYED